MLLFCFTCVPAALHDPRPHPVPTAGRLTARFRGDPDALGCNERVYVSRGNQRMRAIGPLFSSCLRSGAAVRERIPRPPLVTGGTKGTMSPRRSWRWGASRVAGGRGCPESRRDSRHDPRPGARNTIIRYIFLSSRRGIGGGAAQTLSLRSADGEGYGGRTRARASHRCRQIGRASCRERVF